MRAHTETQGQSHVPIEAEIGMVHLQAKECAKDGRCHQKPGRVDEGFPCKFHREHDPMGTLILDFYPPELGDNTNSIVLSHPVCGTSLGQASLEDELPPENPCGQLSGSESFTWP